MFGQSNITGADDAAPDSSYLGVQPHTKILYKNGGTFSSDINCLWQSYIFGVNNYISGSASWVGADVSLGKTYYDLTGRDLWIIKYGYGGSNLVDVGVSSPNGIWQWDANLANCNGLPHYTNVRDGFLFPAISRAKANGIDLNIKGLDWMQGESEALGGTGYLTYETTLISLIDKFVSDLTPLGVLSSTFKPIISRINGPGRIYRTEIRTALVNVANHYSAPWIDNDSYGLYDSVHYNTAGQVQRGIDIATILASL